MFCLFCALAGTVCCAPFLFLFHRHLLMLLFLWASSFFICTLHTIDMLLILLFDAVAVDFRLIAIISGGREFKLWIYANA